MELDKILPGSETAVLMVHGIVGTPHHFDFLLSAVPASCSIYRIWLPGHGGDIAAFGRASMAQWRSAVSEKVKQILTSHKRLYIVAHSMGCLFALQEAIRLPEQIAGLFLLAVPLYPRLTFRAAVGAVRVALEKEGTDPVASSMRTACGTVTDRRLWRYIPWIPRFLELFQEAAAVRKLTGQVTVSCRIYQSRRDELVAFSSMKPLQLLTNAKISVLEKSGHFAYDAQEADLLRRELTAIFHQ